MSVLNDLPRMAGAVIVAGVLSATGAGEADAKPVSDKIAFTVEQPCGNGGNELGPGPIPSPIPDWLEGIIKLPIGTQTPFPPLATGSCDPENPRCKPPILA